MVSNYLYHGPARPCPLCDGATDCRTNLITGGVSCRRTSEKNPPTGWGYARQDSQGFGVFYPDGNHEPITPWAKEKIERVKKAKKDKAAVPGGTTAFARISADMRPMTPAEREKLAELLTLPTGIFDLIGVQYLECDDGNRPAWVFPEKNAAGATTGLTLRYHDGSKKNHGKRGLCLPATWATSTGPVYLCEGASDTLALLAMNLSAIGRPNNVGGIDELIELLRKVDPHRRVIVLGENDRKASGKWPGREGAEKTATTLASTLGRPIAVALPPNGTKDVREVIASAAAEIRAKRKTLRDVGEEFEAHCEVTAEVFSPPDVRDVPAEFVEAAAEESGAAPRLGFTAADCLPPIVAEIEPEKPAPTRCQNVRSVLMRNDAERKTRLCMFDCQRLTCGACGPKKRAQWQATVQQRLQDRGDRPVVTFWASAKQWASVSKALRTAGASYFRLDVEDDRMLVVATAAPATGLASGAAESTPQDASDRLCAAIDYLPSVREKALSFSRDWKLLGNRRSPEWQGWRRISKIASSRTALWEVLEFHKIDWQPVSYAGSFFGWTAWEWSDNQITARGGFRQVYDDLMMGEVLPDVDWFPAGPDDVGDGDEWSGTATGPPVSIDQVW